MVPVMTVEQTASGSREGAWGEGLDGIHVTRQEQLRLDAQWEIAVDTGLSIVHAVLVAQR